MLDLLKLLMPFGLLSLTGDGGGGTGDAGKGAGDGKGSGEDKTDYKAEFEKIKGEQEKTKGDLEDMRLEVLSPEYLEYLNTKDGKAGAGAPAGAAGAGDKPAASDTTISDEAFGKMSPKEVYDKAKADALTEMGAKMDKFKTDFSSNEKARTSQEIAAFARNHEDYETYRPVMYGLSLDPKNKNLTLAELYTESKAHVKRIHTGTTEKEKAEQNKSGGEKPGGDTNSYERTKDLTPEAAAKEAFAETKTKLGIDKLPTA